MAKTTKSGKTSAKATRAKSATRKAKGASRAARKVAAGKSKTAPKRKTVKPATKPRSAKAASGRGSKVKPKTKPVPKAKASAKHRVKPAAKAKPKAREVGPGKREKARPQSLVARLEAQAVQAQTGRDWSETLFLPKTDFPMKAGLPEREPELLKRWERLGLRRQCFSSSACSAPSFSSLAPPFASAMGRLRRARSR